MEIVSKSDPLTGIEVTVLMQDNKDMTFENLFTGCVTLHYNESKDCYEVPADLFDYRPTMGATKAARYLGVSRQRINALCNDGTLRACKVNGTIVIDKTSIDNYKESRK